MSQMFHKCLLSNSNLLSREGSFSTRCAVNAPCNGIFFGIGMRIKKREINSLVRNSMEIEKKVANASKVKFKSNKSIQHTHFPPCKFIYFCNCIIVSKSLQAEIH